MNNWSVDTLNTFTCTRGAEGDTPQLAPWEACRKRDTQDNPAGTFDTRRPGYSGGTPSEYPATIGCSKSS